MAVLRLIDALPDFGVPARKPATTEQPVAAAHVRAAPPTPAVSIDEIVRAEVEQAQRLLEMRLSVDHEAALMVERQRHAEELQALQFRHGEETGTMLDTRLGELQQGISDHVTAAVARLLGGVLSDDLCKRSIASLAKSIAVAVGDAETMRIEVRGPQSMFAGLSEALAGRMINLHHVEADGVDLSVTVHGTVFETRLSEWSAILTEILA